MVLARRAGMTILTGHVTTKTLTRLATEADIEFDELAAVHYGPPRYERARYLYGSRREVDAWFHGQPIHWAFLRGNSVVRRVCPECLEMDGYHRAVWDLSFGSVCPVHERDMIVRCCKCGRNFTWSRGILDRCVCGETNLLAESPRLTRPEFLDPIAIGFGLLGDERFTAFATAFLEVGPLVDLSPYNALTFIYMLGARLEAGTYGDHKLDVQTHFHHEFGAEQALTRGVQAIGEWSSGNYHRTPERDVETDERNRVTRRVIFKWLVGLPAGQGVIARQDIRRDPLGIEADFNEKDFKDDLAP